MIQPLTEEQKLEVLRGGFLDCKYIHEGSCFSYSFFRMALIFKKTYKSYILLYLIPLFLFKMKQLRKNPKKVLFSTLVAYLRSVAFICGFVSMLTYGLCMSKNIRGKVDNLNVVLATIFSSLASLLETDHRRKEINLFILPRSIETIYKLLRRRGFIIDLSNYANILFGILLD